jgi:hypothetical protein
LWKIYVCISPKGTTHWSPLIGWKHGIIHRKSGLKKVVKKWSSFLHK